jgi:hypothetical protein
MSAATGIEHVAHGRWRVRAVTTPADDGES